MCIMLLLVFALTYFTDISGVNPIQCPAHLSVIRGDFVLESVVRYAALVCYSESGDCPLFGSRRCTVSTGIAVGTSPAVRYSEEVRYWEGPLSEVPLYSPRPPIFVSLIHINMDVLDIHINFFMKCLYYT